jgi:hypothetical protein
LLDPSIPCCRTGLQGLRGGVFFFIHEKDDGLNFFINFDNDFLDVGDPTGEIGDPTGETGEAVAP